LGNFLTGLVADAGYGSEENYEYLEEKGVEAYVKFNNFHKEQTKKWKDNPQYVDNLHYNSETGLLLLPDGASHDLYRQKKVQKQEWVLDLQKGI
jgi:hypothetical protein